MSDKVVSNDREPDYTRAIEFENIISDLITEHFKTKQELLDAVKYFGDTTIASELEDSLQWFEDETEQEKEKV